MKRICKTCGVEKEIDRFLKRGTPKGQKFVEQLYRYVCKDCDNTNRRKKNPNFSTRFQKGQPARNPFPKGHIPWSTGRYRSHGGIGRQSHKYKMWRKEVYERDGHKCKECFSENYLEPHHIFSFDKYPDKRFDVDNGVTLCRSCHKRIEGMLKRLKNAIIIWQRR